MTLPTPRAEQGQHHYSTRHGNGQLLLVRPGMTDVGFDAAVAGYLPPPIRSEA
jgi:hypothetical protein